MIEKTTNQRLLDLTANMPCKQINLPCEESEPTAFFCEKENKFVKPYIQRYFAGAFRDNKDLLIHRFLSGDSERHLHCHPFEFTTIMLHGRYDEEYIDRGTKSKVIRITTPDHLGVNLEQLEKDCRLLNHGIYMARPWADSFLKEFRESRFIDVFDWHRVVFAAPETWTALIVDADRLPFWHFADEKGKFKAEQASARDWWKNYGVRGENKGDVL